MTDTHKGHFGAYTRTLSDESETNLEKIAQLRGYAAKKHGALVMARDILTNGLQGDALDYEHAIKQALSAMEPALQAVAP